MTLGVTKILVMGRSGIFGGQGYSASIWFDKVDFALDTHLTAANIHVFAENGVFFEFAEGGAWDSFQQYARDAQLSSDIQSRIKRVGG